MDGEIIVYDTSGLSKAKKTSFGRKLYGYTDKSNNGQYEYYRSGLLDEIPSRKLVRGVVIVREEDAEKVIDLTKDYGVKTFRREIKLSSEDRENLSSQDE